MVKQIKHFPKDPDRFQFTVDQVLKDKKHYTENEDFLDEERRYQDKIQIPVLPETDIVHGNIWSCRYDRAIDL